MLYRVNRPLKTGEVPGDIVSDRMFRKGVVRHLVQRHILLPMESPPLTDFSGWERRAELLKPLGVVTIIDFLEADEDKIREAWGHKTLRGVNRAKEELRALLDVPVRRSRRSRPCC